MRYLVVHAHLYQPPRENPWTEVIERQPSAAPFHDWNERVSDECYERLGGAGVRRPDGRIIALANLFGRISFNIGPTLAAWLDQVRPEVMRDAAAGDKAALDRTGFGSAMMQPYGHPILPLCEAREKRLQLAWGRADFLLRFGRCPEGVWLPECAVDLPTLEACAAAGLKFTILAPEQVLRIGPLGGPAMEDVSGSRVPPHRPYLVRLPSGRTFTVFIFDGPLSRGAAFSGVLRSGEGLLNAVRGALNGIPEPDGLVMLAADGETFGHHQKHAEEALAEALLRARLSGLCQVSHLGELFSRFPARHQAILASPSSWSCAHGVGRWERDCGCGAGAHGTGWNWSWRQVLRHATSILRDRVFSLVDRRGAELFTDPWEAAEGYGDVVVHPPNPQRIEALISRHVKPGLPDSERSRAAACLELIRQTLFAATSCGWFFDDIAGIEAVQVMRHAARAAELAEVVFGIDLIPDLERNLAQAKANERGAGTGADVFRSRALTARRGFRDAAGAHASATLKEALVSSQAPSSVSNVFGSYTTEDQTVPFFHFDSNQEVEVRGQVLVRHLRSLSEKKFTFSLVSPEPGATMELLLDGQPTQPCPTIREQLLRLAARRASNMLPAPSEAVLNKIAWIGREARDLGTPLPSPFPEAIRGAGRALVTDLLARPPRDPEMGIQLLTRALSAAHAAGITVLELADLRPALARQLAYYASWAFCPTKTEALPLLIAAIDATRKAAGEGALARLRRWIVETNGAIPTDQTMALLESAGLTPDALVPLDIPVQPIDEEQELDNLV